MADPQPPIRLDQLMLIEPEHAPPDHSQLVRILNALYAAESRSLFRYLENWEPYTDARTIKLRSLVRSIRSEGFEHVDRLSQLIQSFGGVTTAGSFDDDFAHINYTDWATMLPQLIETKGRIVDLCEQAKARVRTLPGHERVLPALEAVGEENRRHLVSLKQWQDKVSQGKRSDDSPPVDDA